MPFPTTGVLDAFNRANGGLGADWTTAAGFGGAAPRVLSNQASPAAGGGFSMALYDVAQYGNTEVYADLVTLPAGWSIALFARYDLVGTMYSVGASAGYTQLSRWVGYTETILATSTVTAWAAGEKLGLRVNGTKLEVWRYTAGVWSLILEATDDDVPAQGYTGFWASDSGAGTTAIDNFGGGTYSTFVASVAQPRRLELTVEIEKANGQRYRWAGDEPDPANRPSGLKHKTRLMEGYAEAEVSVPRGSTTAPDLELYDTIRFISMDGEVVYEGRGAGIDLNRSKEQQRVAYAGAGWMSHTRDRPCPPLLFVDRDMTRWGPASSAEKEAGVAAGFPRNWDPQVLENETGAALTLLNEGAWDVPTIPVAQALYLAPPGQNVGRVKFTAVAYNPPLNTNFQLLVEVNDADAVTAWGAGDVLTATGTFGVDYSEVGRFAHIAWLYNSSPAGADGAQYPIYLKDVAVFGDHALDTHTDSASREGYLVSDLITYTAGLYAPLLDTSRIEDTTFVVTQAYEPGLIDPYDFWLRLNKYEMKYLAVWKDRQLHYTTPSAEADWVISEGDIGTVIKDAGASIEAQANGVIVQYQDITTGRSAVLTPDDDAALADTNPDLPANIAGVKAWESIQLPNPDSAEGAARYGSLVLQRLNAQRLPSTVTVRGYIRDRAGNLHPGWSVKAEDNVLVESVDGNTLRRVHETEWDGDSNTLTLNLDGQAQGTDAILDQILTEAGKSTS